MGRGKGSGPGRPPGPCNEREKAARRTNPVKHGQRSESGALASGLKVCKKEFCPRRFENEAKNEDLKVADRWKCDLRLDRDRNGEGTTTCMRFLPQDVELESYVEKALAAYSEEGEGEFTKELVQQLGSLMALVNREMAMGMVHGVSSPVLVPDQEGNVRLTGYHQNQVASAFVLQGAKTLASLADKYGLLQPKQNEFDDDLLEEVMEGKRLLDEMSGDG